MKLNRLLAVFIALSSFWAAWLPTAKAQVSCSITVSADTAVCPNALVQLQAIGQPDTLAFRYKWSPANGLNNPAIANPLVLATQSETYTVTATTLDSTELVFNGDFELGNTGFISEYRDSSSLWNQGTFAITPNPSLLHPAFSACADHTSATGQMLAANGTSKPNTVVWAQTISVTPQTEYEFSAWVQNILVNTATLPSLQFSINGQLIGSVFKPTNVVCQWQQFFTTWLSGNSTSAFIEIKNQSVFDTGNDFAIDDISFRAACNAVASVRVEVIVPLSLDDYGIAPTDTLVCDALPIVITSNYPDAVSFLWSDGTTSPTIEISSAGTYVLQMTDLCNRTFTDSIRVLADSSPVQNLPSDTLACADKPIALNAYQPNATAYQWRGSSVHYLQNQLDDSVFIATFEGIYEVDVTTACGTLTQTIRLEHQDCSCVPFVPNAFTPNEDGDNDQLWVFAPLDCQLTEFQFSVYDRWGALVFFTNDVALGWNGKINNEKDATTGVYVWKLEFTGADQRGEPLQQILYGDVVVLR